MPTWSLLDPRYPAAVLLASIFMPWAGAEELPATRVKLKRRSPVQQVSAEAPASEDEIGTSPSATARWTNLKSRFAEEEASALPAAPKKRVAGRPQNASLIRPIPDAEPEEEAWDSAEAPAAEPEWLADEARDEPLPITGFEEAPDWILGATPAPEQEELDQEVAPGHETPTRISARAFSEETEKPEAEAKSESLPDPGYTPMPGNSASRRPRQINEISPKYDVDIDQDIRAFAKQQAAQYGLAFAKGVYQPRSFYGLAYQWEPSNFYHYPLYFEDPALERYGHTYNPVVQPMVSIARFGGQLIMLPYQMTLDPICTPKYALGWYRPGECAPKLHYQVPLNAQAAAVEAGVVTGLFYLIP